LYLVWLRVLVPHFYSFPDAFILIHTSVTA
jgi:hypothetical protein